MLDYEEMLLDPRATFQRLSKELNLLPGTLTEDIIISIKAQNSDVKDRATSSYELDIDKLVLSLPAKLQNRASILDL